MKMKTTTKIKERILKNNISRHVMLDYAQSSQAAPANLIFLPALAVYKFSEGGRQVHLLNGRQPVLTVVMTDHAVCTHFLSMKDRTALWKEKQMSINICRVCN